MATKGIYFSHLDWLSAGALYSLVKLRVLATGLHARDIFEEKRTWFVKFESLKSPKSI